MGPALYTRTLSLPQSEKLINRGPFSGTYSRAVATLTPWPPVQPPFHPGAPWRARTLVLLLLCDENYFMNFKSSTSFGQVNCIIGVFMLRCFFLVEVSSSFFDQFASRARDSLTGPLPICTNLATDRARVVDSLCVGDRRAYKNYYCGGLSKPLLCSFVLMRNCFSHSSTP